MSDEHVSVTKVPNFTGKKFRVFDSQFKAVCMLKSMRKRWKRNSRRNCQLDPMRYWMMRMQPKRSRKR